MHKHPLTLAREAAGITSGDVAQSLGVARSAVVRWEQGVRMPRPHQLVALKNLLNVTADEIVDHYVNRGGAE